MNWEAISAIGQVAGAIAVVATLFYLASQIKQNTNATKAESRRAALESGHTVLFQMADNPRLVSDLTKSESLTDEEQIRLSAFLFATLRNGEFAWGQYRDRAIDDQQWATERNVIRFVFDTKRARDWWNHLGRGPFGGEFAEYVDSVLDAHPPTETMWQGYYRWDGHDAA